MSLVAVCVATLALFSSALIFAIRRRRSWMRARGLTTARGSIAETPLGPVDREVAFRVIIALLVVQIALTTGLLAATLARA